MHNFVIKCHRNCLLKCHIFFGEGGWGGGLEPLNFVTNCPSYEITNKMNFLNIFSFVFDKHLSNLIRNCVK